MLMAQPRRNALESLTDSQRSFLSLPEPVAMVGNGQSSPAAPFQRPSAIGRQHPVDPDSDPPAGKQRRRVHLSHSQRPEPLRSVTLRLQASTAEALRRASMERSMDYREPFSQQDIAEAALRSWLSREGYPTDR